MIITVEYKDNEYYIDITSPVTEDVLDDIETEWWESITASAYQDLDVDWIKLFTDILERRNIKYKYHTLDIDRTFRF